MRNYKIYPKYMSYSTTKQPTVIEHHFPLPAFTPDETYYPTDARLAHHLATPEERQRYGAAAFCGFLADTIAVEHHLVIPAITALARLPFSIPMHATQDLYASVTDEGFHAEQSLRFLSTIQAHFAFEDDERFKVPLFLARLTHQRAAQPTEIGRDLTTVLNGVVTETRISIELGRFAKDRTLAPSVREVCREHAQDEVVHSSQFVALAQWLWSEFDEPTRRLAAEIFAKSMIARNLPDVRRIAFNLHQATMRPMTECLAKVLAEYTTDVLIDALYVVARPTIDFVSKLGVTNYVSIDAEIQQERERLRSEFEEMRSVAGALDGVHMFELPLS